MATAKQIKKLRNTHPEWSHLNDKTLDNWLEQRRDLDICALCPENTRGLCCYGALEVPLPSRELCNKTCTEYLRTKCTFNRTNLPEKSEIVYIIMLNQPCKYLDPNTKLCTVYENRFWKKRTCLDVKQAIIDGAVPAGCAYLSKNKRKKYIKRPHKILLESLDKEKLCDWCIITFDLYNTSPNEGEYGIHQY